MPNRNPLVPPGAKPGPFEPEYVERASWTSEMELGLLTEMISEIQRGNRPEHVYRKSSWETIRRNVNAEFGKRNTMKQIKDKYTSLKKRWNAWDACRNHPSFGFDEQTGLPVASDEAWEEVIAKHPMARFFKTAPIEHQDELGYVFGGIPTVPRSKPTRARPPPPPPPPPAPAGQHTILPGAPPMTPAEDSSGFSPATFHDALEPEHDDVNVHHDSEANPRKRQRLSFSASASAGTGAGGKAGNAGMAGGGGGEEVDLDNAVPRAVARLQDEYGERLSVEDFVASVGVMESVRKAKVFLVLRPGIARDRWLEAQLQRT